METQGDELLGYVDGADPAVVVAVHGVGELAPFDRAVEGSSVMDAFVELDYERGKFGCESGDEGLQRGSGHGPSLLAGALAPWLVKARFYDSKSGIEMQPFFKIEMQKLSADYADKRR